MTCPKCHGSMRTVNRQGVRLEQCENCRGIFLDHGELEHILTAEQGYYGGEAPYAAPGAGYHGGHPGSSHSYRDSPRPYREARRPYRDSPRPYREDHHGYHSDSPRPYGHRRGHGSFLGNLFG